RHRWNRRHHRYGGGRRRRILGWHHRQRWHFFDGRRLGRIGGGRCRGDVVGGRERRRGRWNDRDRGRQGRRRRRIERHGRRGRIGRPRERPGHVRVRRILEDRYLDGVHRQRGRHGQR